MTILGIDLDLLTPAERRDLANALLRAAWSAALEDIRIMLLDLLIEVDEAAIGGWSWASTRHVTLSRTRSHPSPRPFSWRRCRRC